MPDGTPPLVHENYLKQFKWGIFEQLPPSDYHLFLQLKTLLAAGFSQEQPREKRRTEPDENFDDELLRRRYTKA